MKVVFDSWTGNVKKFVTKLNLNAVQIDDYIYIDEPYVLITYTIWFGKVPELTQKFLDKNYVNLKGVASSGNRNWGENYGIAADIISNTYNVPLLMKFELAGTDNDIEVFKERLREIERS